MWFEKADRQLREALSNLERRYHQTNSGSERSELYRETIIVKRDIEYLKRLKESEDASVSVVV